MSRERDMRDEIVEETPRCETIRVRQPTHDGIRKQVMRTLPRARYGRTHIAWKIMAGVTSKADTDN